ncbi:unnamed protein product [Phytomonas sp. Hart1]|nr:unnamed protein product [Phytomonas sp. Hart1]|eukprot:CCW71058.1 unnamed protein product [Phytomonas sp. isolate Hart1]
MDLRGIEFEAVLVAHTARYAYVACPCGDPALRGRNPASQGLGVHSSEEPISWVLISRLPIPSFLVETAEVGNRKRGASAGGGRFLQLVEGTRFDNAGPLRELSEAHKRRITIRAHGVRCRELRGALADTSPFFYKGVPLFLWFEEAHLLDWGPFHLPGASGEVKTEAYDGVWESDLIPLVEASCQRYLRTCRKMNRYLQANGAPSNPEGPLKSRRVDASEHLECALVDTTSSSADDVALRLRAKLRQGKARLAAKANAVFSRITDTRSVHYKKLRRKPFNSVPLIRTSRDVKGLFEGPTVEFKHHLSSYRAAVVETPEDGPDNAKKGPVIMDVERVRHTIAAMASTMGGVLCVGVSDEGEIIGHERGAVVKTLRTTGFCPVMVKDSVVVKELPVLNPTSSKDTSNTGLDPPLKALPKDWWKMPSMTLPTTGSGQARDLPCAARDGGDEPRNNGGEMEPTLQEHLDKVLTIITVSKGSAPFYSSCRTVLPYLRGCASTVRMPGLIMARRLAGQFEGEITYDD